MIIHKGDYFKVRTFFKFDSNSFFKGDLLRIVRVGRFLDGMGGFCKVSNKSWIFSQEGHSVYRKSAYSFGRNTNWFVRFAALEAHCTLLKEREWE